MAEGAFWNNWKNTALPTSGSTISNPNASGAYAGFKGGESTSVAIDPFIQDLFKMSDNEILQVSTLLKNSGYLKNTTSKYNKSLGDAYSRANNDWSVDAARTGRQTLTLRQFLLENQQPSRTGGPKADLSRSVYQYSPEQIDADINEVALKLLGREITDADKQADWYEDLTKGLNKMIGKGTVTTSKLVKNKKTGKLEQVTTQTPKFTKEAAQTKITETLSTADPMSLERKKNLEFANWAFEKMGVRR